jgi:hypothetical protein
VLSSKTNSYYDIRSIVTRHKIGTAIIGGIVATHLGTMFGYWDHVFGMKVLNWNYGNGLQLMLPESHASYTTTYFTGAAAHYMNGLAFALLYAFVIHPLIPIRNTAIGNLAKGLIWGTVLAFTSAIFMNPYVFAPNAHLGFFSHNGGFLFVLSIFIWHWIYGATLGQIYNPLPDDEVVESRVALTNMAINGNGTHSTSTRTADGDPARIPAGIAAGV